MIQCKCGLPVAGPIGEALKCACGKWNVITPEQAAKDLADSLPDGIELFGFGTDSDLDVAS